MEPALIFDNDFIWMVYHEDTKIIHHHYYPKLNSHYLRAGLDTGIDVMMEEGCNKWLSDNREVVAHSPEDTEWINTDWLPRAVDAGWKYWALVVPSDTIALMNMTEFINSFYDMGVWVSVFSDPDEAWDWLISREGQTQTAL